MYIKIQFEKQINFYYDYRKSHIIIKHFDLQPTHCIENTNEPYTRQGQPYENINKRIRVRAFMLGLIYG